MAVEPPEHWPGALLDEAWLEVIRNSAHDSICACSVDEVCDAAVFLASDMSTYLSGAILPLGQAATRWCCACPATGSTGPPCVCQSEGSSPCR